MQQQKNEVDVPTRDLGCAVVVLIRERVLSFSSSRPISCIWKSFHATPHGSESIVHGCILGRRCSLFDILDSAFNAPSSCTLAPVRMRRLVSVDRQPDPVRIATRAPS